MALTTFPERGTSWDEIWPGLRTIGFERRATIIFQMNPTEVLIVRILYGGQDYQRVLHLMRDG
jgi:toxin ParE1/3/4